ncbi:hypothetical protein GS870_24175 [Rhodococcus hoagii]|nr:hypothetical protein [Prescottella equi]
MSGVDPWVWITGGYAAFLVAVAYGLDWLARRIARRAGDWTHGAFIYHRDHDAWECPENEVGHSHCSPDTPTRRGRGGK